MVSVSSRFSSDRCACGSIRGGVYVDANGGAEYGEEWHSAGNLTHKQNVFDDFLAQYLIDQKYTSPSHRDSRW